jgi:nitrogen fixation protein FixH
MRLHWGTGIAAVYTLFACGTVGFVVFAMNKPVELVSGDYYAQSLEYDRRMAARANLQALGAAFSCAVSSDGRALSLRLPSGAAPTPGGTVTLYRPSDSQADHVVALSVDARGEQQIALADLRPGRWRVQVEWDAGATPYYYEQTVDVR